MRKVAQQRPVRLKGVLCLRAGRSTVCKPAHFSIARCRARNVPLFPIYSRLPKLDAVGSNPISRSIFSITCREFPIRESLVFEVTSSRRTGSPLISSTLNNRYPVAHAGIRTEDAVPIYTTKPSQPHLAGEVFRASSECITLGQRCIKGGDLE